MSANKSFSSETSERYSRALFQVADEAKELDAIEREIKIFQSLFTSSADVRNFIHNPTQSTNTQIRFVQLIGKKLIFRKSLMNFFLLLIEKKRMFYVKKIFENFLKLCSKKRGEIKASLISSKELTSNELNEVSKDLSQSIGSKIIFDYKVDKGLIGGLKLQVGSFMIDTSVKNKLKKYEQAMLEN